MRVYYDLHDLLHGHAEFENGLAFEDLDKKIQKAVKHGISKFRKYYNKMDADTDVYYSALVLDPRVKGDYLLCEMESEGDARDIIQTLRDKFKVEYPEKTPSNQPATLDLASPKKVGGGMLRRLGTQKAYVVSDIDRYFDESLVVTDESNIEDPDFLLNWWRANRSAYPRMAAAARDYLAIPASEVSVERLFNSGRDVIGVRRHAMIGETMRILMLLDDIYKQS